MVKVRVTPFSGLAKVTFAPGTAASEAIVDDPAQGRAECLRLGVGERLEYRERGCQADAEGQTAREEYLRNMEDPLFFKNALSETRTSPLAGVKVFLLKDFARFFTVPYRVRGSGSMGCKALMREYSTDRALGEEQSSDGSAHEFRSISHADAVRIREALAEVLQSAPFRTTRQCQSSSEVYGRAHARRRKRSASRTGHRDRSVRPQP